MKKDEIIEKVTSRLFNNKIVQAIFIFGTLINLVIIGGLYLINTIEKIKESFTSIWQLGWGVKIATVYALLTIFYWGIDFYDKRQK